MLTGRYRVKVCEFEWLVKLYRLPFKFDELSRPYLNLMAEYAEGLIRHGRISFEEIKLDNTFHEDNSISKLQGKSIRLIVTKRKHPLLFDGYQEIDRFEKTQIISNMIFKTCKIYIDDSKDIRLLTLKEATTEPVSVIEDEGNVKETDEHKIDKSSLNELNPESVEGVSRPNDNRHFPAVDDPYFSLLFEEMEEEMGEDSISHIEGAEHTNLKELHIDLDTESVLDIDKC